MFLNIREGRNVHFFLDPLRKEECEQPLCFPVYFSFVAFLEGFVHFILKKIHTAFYQDKYH